MKRLYLTFLLFAALFALTSCQIERTAEPEAQVQQAPAEPALPELFRSPWPMDRTDFQPVLFGQFYNPSNHNGLFTAGKYVRHDGLAVLYINYGFTDREFIFEIFGISENGLLSVHESGFVTMPEEGFVATFPFEGETWNNFDRVIDFISLGNGFISISAFMDGFALINGNYFLVEAKHDDLHLHVHGWREDTDWLLQMFIQGAYINSLDDNVRMILRVKDGQEYSRHSVIFERDMGSSAEIITEGTAILDSGRMLFRPADGDFTIMIYPENEGVLRVDVYGDGPEELAGIYSLDVIFLQNAQWAG